MRNHSHCFSVKSTGPKKGDRPFAPYVQVDMLNPRSRNLMSDGEIDAYITELKKDLDRVQIMAKLEIEKLQGRLA